jgi:type IV pilus assembly protein PilA
MRKMLNKLLKKYAKNEKGLTLIELLVVIVILGIIAAIAVVSIGGIIKKTEDKAVVTEAVQIINGAKLAHSTDGKTTWTSTDEKVELTDYVNNITDKSWVVKFSNGKYSIKGHSADVVAGKTADAEVFESDLTAYLRGK